MYKGKEAPYRQTLLGLLLGIAVVLSLVLWLYWSRTVILALALSSLLPAVILLKRPEWGAALLAFVITSGLEYIVPGSIVGASLLTIAVTAYQKFYRGDFTWKVPPFAIWTTLLFTWTIASLLWAKSVNNLIYQPLLYSALIIVVVPELVRTPREFRVVLLAAGLGMVFTAASSFFGVYTIFSRGLAIQAAGSVEGLESARYYGHWISPNHLAHGLMPTIVLLIPLLRFVSSLTQKLFILFSILCGISAVLLSLSRAGILSMGIAMAIVAANSRRRWVLIFSGALFIGLLILTLPVNLLGRIESLTGSKSDASINQREQVLLTASRIAADAFPWGFGFGGFYNRQEDYNGMMTYKVNHAHNTVLQLLAEGGLVSLIVFIGVFLSPLISVKRFIRGSGGSDESVRKIGIAMMGLWWGMLFVSLVEYVVGWPSYWFALSLMSVFPAIYSRPPRVTRHLISPTPSS